MVAAIRLALTPPAASEAAYFGWPVSLWRHSLALVLLEISQDIAPHIFTNCNTVLSESTIGNMDPLGLLYQYADYALGRLGGKTCEKIAPKVFIITMVRERARDFPLTLDNSL
jgi:hypothetical protein